MLVFGIKIKLITCNLGLCHDDLKHNIKTLIHVYIECIINKSTIQLSSCLGVSDVVLLYSM